MASIPLIDLDAWFEGDDDDRHELARSVDAALCENGFLVLVNHGIRPSVFEQVRSLGYTFFNLPDADKQAIAAHDEPHRGWVGRGRESNAASYGVDTPPDMKETFALGPVDVADPALRTDHPEWYAENRWPIVPVGFANAVERWWRSCQALADEMLQLLALALDLDQMTLVERSGASSANGNINWYWPHTVEAPAEGQFRIGPHTDFATITLLDRQHASGGLQVRSADGSWVDAPTVPGSLTMNTGDMLRQWTNDRWSSNEHRVLPPPAAVPDEEALSLVFFHGTHPETVIEPLPTCVSADRPARYEPTTAGAYVGAKLAALVVS